MNKQEKIKRFNEILKLEEINESEIIHEEVQEETPEAAPIEAPYEPTAAEKAEFKAIQEQKRIRFAQLAGLEDEDAPAPKLDESDAPAKYVRPATIKISLLSEGLQAEVKKLVKSGRKKTSEFPEAIKKMISEEMNSIDSKTSEADMQLQKGGAAMLHISYDGGKGWMDVIGVSHSNNMYIVRLKNTSIKELQGFVGGELKIAGLIGSMSGAAIEIYAPNFNMKARLQNMESIRESMDGLDSIKEMGMPAMATDHHGYPELDPFIDKLAFNVGNTITKQLGLQNNDPDFPYKANYIVDQLVHKLQNPSA